MKSTHISKTLFIAFVIVGLSVGAGWAAEDLFLLDSLADDPDLYRVTLDDANGVGILTPIMLNIPNGGSYALACSQDGGRCYIIERDSGYFGYYDLVLDYWQPIGLDFDVQFTGIAGAACADDGRIFVASQDTEMMYVIDPETWKVSIVGDVQSNGVPIDLRGADMACNAAGEMYLWSNAGTTMFLVTLPGTFPGTVEATPVFVASGIDATGMAFRGNGYGPPMGSTRAPSLFLVQEGDGVLAYEMQNFTHRYGDMSNGLMGGFFGNCTRTIGYYKNHDWQGAVVHICGVPIDEDFGANILWNARGSNFSMLFAQMIAAKLNVGDATGVAIIDDAEAWLCQQGNAFDGGELSWRARFENKNQKRTANSYKNPLNDFNNGPNHCCD